MSGERRKAQELRKLAEEAKIIAETTVDPNRKRALRITALEYKRLADFVRSKDRRAWGGLGRRSDSQD